MILENKTSLITGSNRGIGYSILRKFAKEGSDIIAHTRNEDIYFIKKCNELEKENNIKIFHIHFDLLDKEKMKNEILSIIKRKIPIDILVNSAGIIHGGLFNMSTIQSIRDVFEVNFFGQLEITQLVSKYMLRKKTGSIINISSVAGIDLSSGNCGYGTSKAALNAFSKTLADELGQYGIRVNVVAPSLTDTDMSKSEEAKKEREILSANNGFKRMVKPDEVADLVLYLASDKSSFINGQIIRIDGGNRF